MSRPKRSFKKGERVFYEKVKLFLVFYAMIMLSGIFFLPDIIERNKVWDEMIQERYVRYFDEIWQHRTTFDPLVEGWRSASKSKAIWHYKNGGKEELQLWRERSKELEGMEFNKARQLTIERGWLK